MENSKIEWTNHTFSPWVGCTKVSTGPLGACEHCYAESWAKRTGHPELWAGTLRRTRPANWEGPKKWNRQAQRDNVRRRVFCSSLADIFDNQAPIGWRADLFQLIHDTPHLDWLLLTKRIGNAGQMIEHAIRLGGGLMKPEWPWTNVWIGATVANQAEADRDIPKLLCTEAHVRFLSIEPMLEAMNIKQYLVNPVDRYEGYEPAVDWVICGGESGPKARPMQAAWAVDLAHQCRETDTPFFMKQMSQANWPSRFKDFDSFLPAIKVREFPNATRTS